MSTIISAGNFYFGLDEEKYCDLNVHIGNFRIEYQCPNHPTRGNNKGSQDSPSIGGDPDN